MYLRALPNTHSHWTTKEHIQKVFDFMSNFKTKPFTNYRMPWGTKFLVHAFFDHFCCSLSEDKKNTYGIIIVAIKMNVVVMRIDRGCKDGHQFIKSKVWYSIPNFHRCHENLFAKTIKMCGGGCIRLGPW